MSTTHNVIGIVAYVLYICGTSPKLLYVSNIDVRPDRPVCFEFWGPFLERPGNLTGPKSDFEIKISRKAGCVLNSNKVHFVALANNFTV